MPLSVVIEVLKERAMIIIMTNADSHNEDGNRPNQAILDFRCDLAEEHRLRIKAVERLLGIGI